VARDRVLTLRELQAVTWTLPLATLVHEAEELLFVRSEFFEVPEEDIQRMPRVNQLFSPIAG